MPKNPFFSIIIPVYNAAEYLADCLQCIISQDFQDWEVILVDDGSKDNSVEIAEEFACNDSRIKIFTSTQNSGGAYTPRMRAANLASSDMLVIIDADDRVSSDLLSKHYKIITELSADLVIPEMWKLTTSDSYKILPHASIDISQLWIGKDLVYHTLCHWKIPMAGFAIRRNNYLKADTFLSTEEKKSIFADELLSRWILYLCQKVAFSNAHYYYRHNPASVTHTNLPRFIDSKMTTCDNLIAMTTKVYGDYSSTHLHAVDNKFLSIVDSLRLINNSKILKSEKAVALNSLRAVMSNFDMSLLKGRISPRYLTLMSLPLPLARHVLKILDYLLKIK
ncbi:MAG: glycosyltransferase family 2 protein [Bacteroides sp.]|nr:glycosyltransferase family 2 protein [Bacteroides sp.]